LIVLEKSSQSEFLTPLIVKAQRGNQKALDALYFDYYSDIRSSCIRILRSESEGEDAAQNVFMTAMRTLHTFKGECPLKNWLMVIAKNKCLNLLRKKGPDSVSARNLDWQEVGDRIQTAPGVEAEVIVSVYGNQLRSFVRDYAKGPPRLWDALDADIFHLLYEQGIETAREVAERLGRSEDTVKYRIYRRINPVLAGVRKRLQDEQEEKDGKGRKAGV
jgi:RNA polymerase sigma-70 factor (ECF subfamily)